MTVKVSLPASLAHGERIADRQADQVDCFQTGDRDGCGRDRGEGVVPMLPSTITESLPPLPSTESVPMPIPLTIGWARRRHGGARGRGRTSRERVGARRSLHGEVLTSGNDIDQLDARVIDIRIDARRDVINGARGIADGGGAGAVEGQHIAGGRSAAVDVEGDAGCGC